MVAKRLQNFKVCLEQIRPCRVWAALGDAVMKQWRADVVSALPQLRQVAFIMMGEEHDADVAVGHVLRLVHQRTGDISDFPCALSWLLATLMRLPAFNGQNSTQSSVLTPSGLSLLGIPLAERLCLILIDGLKFDLAVASRIVGEPQEAIDARLQRARQMFKCLLYPSQRFTSDLTVEASAALDLHKDRSKQALRLPQPGDGKW